jgi:FtsP/CotA-like multicopper oxidase with cupredoxin domain
MAFAQTPAEEIVANQNRTPAGNLENGTLTLHLEIRTGAWRAEAEDGPKLFVQAFGEVGQVAQIPGPMIRVPAGTTIHVSVANKFEKKATVYGLNTRPGDPKAGVDLAPGESKEFSFEAGEPGTYYYWARTVSKETSQHPLLADAHLNGAYIVDAPGAATPDRVFVINSMYAPPDVLHEDFEVVTINGKSYPYTEPLEYTQGEKIRWRVINPSFSQHPMHLHGSFYQVLDLGDFESNTAYAENDRQWLVTQNLKAGQTMLMEWKPEHPGRWLFHCHFQGHISTEERIPVVMKSALEADSPKVEAQAHHDHGEMQGMNDMAGLVLAINVKAAPGAAASAAESRPAHKIDLVIEPNAAGGKSPTFSCSVREGKKMVASQDKAMGPPMVVTRGEPTEITVVNHLRGSTTIHWHGIELDSYYDGVIGGGAGNRVTPAIPPGGSFTAHFTPNRAGTFIYHTHAADADQLTGGIYGALMVLEPGEVFDPEHDKVLVMGTREASFTATHIILNGTEEPSPIVFNRGVKYRLRLINMAPDLYGDFEIGTKEHPVTWRALAKDGATLPARLSVTSDAVLHIVSGETYDFEFQPDVAGEIPLQVQNGVNKAKLLSKIIVQ